MLHSTKGIVLHYFKYSENSIIVKIFTQKFGLQSYIIKGVNSKKSKASKAYLQPLSLVEITAYYKQKKGLQSLNGIKPDFTFQTIPFNIYKSSIAFFLCEVLNKLIVEEEPNEDLYEFLYYSIQYLDGDDSNYINFHVVFLALLTKYLGIYPQGVEVEETSFFDMEQGAFKVLMPKHVNTLSMENSQVLKAMFKEKYHSEVNISNKNRSEILRGLLDYYTIHLQNLNNLKTKDILSDILS